VAGAGKFLLEGLIIRMAQENSSWGTIGLPSFTNQIRLCENYKAQETCDCVTRLCLALRSFD
jgi:hypothetical protein